MTGFLLDDFSAANGGTLVIPGSHKITTAVRKRRPSKGKRFCSTAVFSKTFLLKGSSKGAGGALFFLLRKTVEGNNLTLFSLECLLIVS